MDTIFHRYYDAALRGGCDAAQAAGIALERIYRKGKKVSVSQEAGNRAGTARDYENTQRKEG